MHILIAGAGIGGLTAAIALTGRGHRVELVDPAPHGAASGVGLNQPANALRVMRALGLLDACLDAGFQYDRTRFCDAAGRVVVEVRSRLGGDGVPANSALSRRVLYSILSDAAERAGAGVRRGVSLVEVAPDGPSAVARCSDGSEASFDAVVGFDGIYSTVRACLFGETVGPQYTGQAVWRVTTSRPSEVTCSTMFQGVRTKAGVIPLGRDEMYLLAVTSEPRSAHFAPSQLPELLRDRLGEFGGVIGDVRDSLDGDTSVVYSPIEEVMLSQPWCRQAVAVAGDAAHASAPHLTQGAAMAMEDAYVLAEELKEGAPVAERLLRWSSRRFARCKFVQEVSHAVLASETLEDEFTLAARLERMPDEVPARLHAVQDVLNTSA